MDGKIDERLHRFLFRYQLTPQSTTGLSQAELLMGRKLRCSLNPIYPEVSKKVLMTQERMIDNSGKVLPQSTRSFREGDKVFKECFEETGFNQIYESCVTTTAKTIEALRNILRHMVYQIVWFQTMDHNFRHQNSRFFLQSNGLFSTLSPCYQCNALFKR